MRRDDIFVFEVGSGGGVAGEEEADNSSGTLPTISILVLGPGNEVILKHDRSVIWGSIVHVVRVAASEELEDSVLANGVTVVVCVRVSVIVNRATCTTLVTVIVDVEVVVTTTSTKASVLRP